MTPKVVMALCFGMELRPMSQSLDKFFPSTIRSTLEEVMMFSKVVPLNVSLGKNHAT